LPISGYHARLSYISFISNVPVEKFYISGVILWKEKHDKTSIFVHTYNYMYMFLIVIVCVGITFSNSLYLQQAAKHQTRMDEYANKSGTFIFNETVDQYRLEACHWEYESLNIVDMMLFAALCIYAIGTCRKRN
jgi:hypothetical protein